ncbi:hypothetical protein [Actinomycetospora soli]|uniref:hypothetical protein n=1 Tax=Actinomycetospora soli TaxID=2893887 RepID=UPI001E57665B|nr:hypothetical protein [Actinomycetospora soli]MCD2189327.1 hypothetical protein [Actinomycetospora soli]
MSIFRSAAIGTLIVGAGLGTLTGVATAHESGHAAQGCSNAVAASTENGSGRSLGDTTGGDQALDASNVCDILNGNQIGSANNVAGGDVVNGDTRTENSDVTETSSIVETITGLLPI